MAVKSGFFDAVLNSEGKPDKVYTAEEFSSIFDGLIKDGVYSSITAEGHTPFEVTYSGRVPSVNKGRAWFDHVWLYNSGLTQLTQCSTVASSKTRIDYIIIKIDKVNRKGTIEVKEGVATTDTPTAPTLTNNSNVNEYPIASLYLNSSGIYKTYNLVGTTLCPTVDYILETPRIGEIITEMEDNAKEEIKKIIEELKETGQIESTYGIAEINGKTGTSITLKGTDIITGASTTGSQTVASNIEDLITSIVSMTKTIYDAYTSAVNAESKAIDALNKANDCAERLDALEEDQEEEFIVAEYVNITDKSEYITFSSNAGKGSETLFVLDDTTVHFQYVSNSVKHSRNEELFTINSNYGPEKSISFPCVLVLGNSTKATGSILVRGDGRASVYGRGPDINENCVLVASGSYKVKQQTIDA